MQKIVKKYAGTVTEKNIDSTNVTELQSHMKDKGHSYLFEKRRFLILGQVLALDVVSVLLSALVERCFVSRMQDFFLNLYWYIVVLG